MFARTRQRTATDREFAMTLNMRPAIMRLRILANSARGPANSSSTVSRNRSSHPLEVFDAKRFHGVELRVHLKRIPAVLAVRRRAEKKTLPEVADDREMMREIELYNFGEEAADDIVGHRLRVEGAHQLVDRITRFNVILHVTINNTSWCGRNPLVIAKEMSPIASL